MCPASRCEFAGPASTSAVAASTSSAAAAAVASTSAVVHRPRPRLVHRSPDRRCCSHRRRRDFTMLAPRSCLVLEPQGRVSLRPFLLARGKTFAGPCVAASLDIFLSPPHGVGKVSQCPYTSFGVVKELLSCHKDFSGKDSTVVSHYFCLKVSSSVVKFYVVLDGS